MEKYMEAVDSDKNMSIIREMVSREIMANISDFSEYLFGEEYGKYADTDSFKNGYSKLCPKCGESVAEEDEDEEGQITCPMCGETFDEQDIEYEPAEILEYWIVSPWLGKRLAQHGETVLERYSGWIWGRACSGQAIYLDCVMARIAEDAGILVGQEHEWSENV